MENIKKNRNNDNKDIVNTKKKNRENIARKVIALMMCVLMILSLAACNSNGSSASKESDGTASTISKEDVTNPENIEDLKIDNSKWQYDADNDVYYQIGISYVTDAEDENTENLAIYVPGAYMDAEDNGDGTYTCTINNEKEVNGYTAENAPIVMPVDTPGYAAQEAVTEYSYDSVADYIEAGYIYVHVGARGRSMSMGESGSSDETQSNDESSAETGAPWGVTDFKAAIRYLRYNAGSIAGDTEKIFVFGMSGGGAQSAVIGSSGDSSLYYSYLQKIGAAMLDDEGNYISDAVTGSMAWCPITNLSSGNEAYEWMMGQYSSDGTRADNTWTSALSDDLAEAYAEYINSIGLTDEDGNKLTLEESEDEIYTVGTYYEYLKKTIKESLNNFLEDTEFPYTSGQNTEQAGMKSDSGKGSGGFGGNEKKFKRGEKPSGNPPEMDGNGPQNGQMPGKMPGMGSDSSEEQVTYKTAKDYIDALNEDGEWITYDEKTGKATITSVEAFVQHCKNASKSVGAFDGTDASQTENEVFSTSEGSLHFDETMAELIKNNSSEYSKYSDYDSSIEEAYTEDFEKTDSVGNTVGTRSDMYDPMYYLTESSEGYGTSTLAKYWRINTGIEQSDTSLTTEMNLSLALEANDSVESVDFTTVWEQGHTMAERTGNSTENFIKWVDSCCR